MSVRAHPGARSRPMHSRIPRRRHVRYFVAAPAAAVTAPTPTDQDDNDNHRQDRKTPGCGRFVSGWRDLIGFISGHVISPSKNFCGNAGKRAAVPVCGAAAEIRTALLGLSFLKRDRADRRVCNVRSTSDCYARGQCRGGAYDGAPTGIRTALAPLPRGQGRPLFGTALPASRDQAAGK